MEFKIHTTESKQIAELVSETELHSVSDFLDLIGNAGYQGYEQIIVSKAHLPQSFFDLKTKFAGDILQKFSNYKMKLAIVGNFSEYKSSSLNDFIRESNKLGHIVFVSSLANAVNCFAQP